MSELSEQTVSDVEELLGTSDFEKALNEQIEKTQKKPDTEDKKVDTPAKEETVVEDPEKKPDESKDNDPTEVETAQSPENSDESEPTADQIENWKKAFENKEKWNKTYQQRSMADSFMSKLTDEQLERVLPRVMPLVHGQEQLPENIDDVVSDTLTKLDIPDHLTLKDEDFDEEINVPKEVYEPLLKKVAENVIKNILPELPVLRNKAKEYEEKMTEMDAYVKNIQVENGRILLDSFSREYPDAIPERLNDSESAAEAVDRIMQTPDHPEYGKYEKIEQAGVYRLKQIEKGNKISFTQAYERLFGTSIRSERLESEAKKNLEKRKEGVNPESPGKPVPKDENADLYNYVGSSHERQVEEFMNKQMG